MIFSTVVSKVFEQIRHPFVIYSTTRIERNYLNLMKAMYYLYYHEILHVIQL